MSVQTQIDRLTKAKSDLRTAIANKGVSVPDSALLDSYPGYVDNIQTGGDIGSRKTVEYTANGSYSISPDEGYGGIAGADITVSVPEKRIEDLKIGYATQNGYTHITPSTGYDVMKKVSVVVSVKANTQEKTLDLTDNGTYEITPDTNYDGLSKATVNVNVPQAGGKFILPDKTTFYDSRFTSIDLSECDLSQYTGTFYYSGKYYGLFSYCYDLAEIKFSKDSFHNVTTMNSMFSGCINLTSLDLISFNTTNVTSMSSMFDSCEKLTSLDLSNFNTSNVTNMSYMFNRCRGLTTLDISNFDTSNVTNMYSMFSSCNGLTTVKVTNCSEATQQKILTQLQTDLSSYTWALSDGTITRS